MLYTSKYRLANGEEQFERNVKRKRYNKMMKKKQKKKKKAQHHHRVVQTGHEK